MLRLAYAAPLLDPKAVLFGSSDNPFDVGVAFGIIAKRKVLFSECDDPPRKTSCPITELSATALK
ncbi:MAG: hypothetical protein ACTSRC_22480 [Candidatus Helarchaeota archaeon]